MSNPGGPELLKTWALSTLAWNALYHYGIITVDDLRQTDQDELQRVPNLGKINRNRLLKEAEAHGIDIPKRRVTP
jgi:DNA-directed RNA polymerase alpha subunit